MCDGIKTNLQSIVQFLTNPGVEGFTRQELINECRDCLEELRGRVTARRNDKGGGTVVNPEARAAVPVVSLVLRHMREGNDAAALAEANRALEILRDWF